MKKKKSLFQLEKYLRNQWSIKHLLIFIIFILFLALISADLKINYSNLFVDGPKYFVDIIDRMTPPDFSNLSELIFSMIETIEMAILGTVGDFFINTVWLVVCKKYSPKLFYFFYRKIFCSFF